MCRHFKIHLQPKGKSELGYDSLMSFFTYKVNILAAFKSAKIIPKCCTNSAYVIKT